MLAGRSGVERAHPGVGRPAAGTDRRPARGRAGRGARPGQAAPAGPVRGDRADRRRSEAWADAGLADAPASTRSGSRSASAPASAGPHPARPGRHPGGVRARGGSPRTPCRCSCPTGRPPGSGWNSAPRPGCTRWPAPAPPAPRRSRWGLDLIRSGRADVVVAGGTEAVIHPLPIAGFAAMRAMSTRNDEPERASRPWDKGRDGFVLGEGAGSRRPGAGRPRRRARGPGLRAARRRRHHLRRVRHRAAAPARAGRGPRDQRRRCATPDMAGADIVHVNAHATSTPVGDMAEVVGAARRARRPPGADRDQVDDRAPARRGRRAGVDRHHPGHPRRRGAADDQPRRPRRRARPGRGRAQGRASMEIPAALNNSFGFGGHNVALALHPTP